MKIRNGFVSNSSSSSFIIGIAKVTDLDKLKKYISDKGIKTDYEFNIITKYDLEQNPPWDVKMKSGKIALESFMGDTVSINSDDMNGLDIMLIYDYTGHDDSDFWNGDEYDYDIDLSLFYENERKIYNMFFDEDSGIDTETSQVQYGAGRNG
jgi:hypothetical protein